MTPAPETCAGEFARALQHALSERPHAISPKWFYDAEGSRLFDTLCELPEYYLTRAEDEILSIHARDLVQRASRAAPPAGTSRACRGGR